MSAEGAKILVVDDEQAIRRFLRASLSAHGHRVAEAENGEQALLQAATQQPDVILLDLGLPDIDGMEVIRQVRQWSSVPILILSARGQEAEKVAALDAGADDYLTKPFGMEELLARLRVALRHAIRRGAATESAIFELDRLRVDLGKRRVEVQGREIHLTPTEFRLLTVLIHHAGKVVTHRQLLSDVWGPDSIEETHSLRVYMARLRDRIEIDSTRPKYLLTEPGVGYRLVDELK